MSSALDMPLDELIKKNKKSNHQHSSSNLGGRGGPTRRPMKRQANRSNPYSYHKAKGGDYGVYTDQLAACGAPAARVSSIETATKLYISNLDYGVSNDDIKELFSDVGDLKRYSIHYDKSGRSKGTAEVVFSRKEHALAAVKRYDSVKLDGKPMKIEVVGKNIEKHVAFPVVPNSGFRNNIGISKSGSRGRGGPLVRARGGFGGRRGGRGGGRGRGEKMSTADLDAELDKYHQSAAMEVN